MVKDCGKARYFIMSATSFYFAGWNKHILQYYKYFDIICIIFLSLLTSTGGIEGCTFISVSLV